MSNKSTITSGQPILLVYGCVDKKYHVIVQDLQFRVSSLLLLETMLECALKTGDYPTCYVQQVVDDVSALTSSVEEACSDALPLSVFQLTATKMCKVCCFGIMDIQCGH